jgi:mono/diheme cytochrome c family protein
MEHVRQLQLALTILLTALVLLIVAGGALFYASRPSKATATAVVTDPKTAEEATDPQPKGAAQPVALDAAAEQGKKIFSDNCQVCHSVGAEKVIGPGLKDVTKRRPEAWLISWIKNSQKVIESGDKYAVDLYNAYNKTPMPPYAFSDDEIKSVLKYIEAAGQ